jgi:hypothetical protein
MRYFASLLLGISCLSIVCTAKAHPVVQIPSKANLCASLSNQYLEQRKMHIYLKWLVDVCVGEYGCKARNDHVAIHQDQLWRMEKALEDLCNIRL